jgi:hypothetical protein
MAVRADPKSAAGANLLLVLVAGIAVAMTTPAERYWWLAPTVAGFAALLVIWFNWGQHRIRSWRMRRAFNVHLTTAEGKEVFYEMHWPRDSEVLMQLRIKPRLHFTRHELVFGFLGDPSSRPVPIRSVNTFVKRGIRREQGPEENEKHILDHNDNYHIAETREWTRPNTYALGFLVQTRKPGRYPIRLELITDAGESKPVERLVLIVEDRLSGALLC